MSDKKQTNTIGKNLAAYYRYHSALYDLTRWTFLFGRTSLIEKLPELPSKPRIMEVGCGTGRNLQHLRSAYPDACIYGVDLSPDMLDKAKKKVAGSKHVVLIKAEYGMDELDTEPFDLILLSYSLTLTGERLTHIIQQARDDLKPSGYIAVVDFHQTPFKSFQRWMTFNHVVMDGKVLSMLNQYFERRYENTQKAYGGLWTYFQFIGQRS